MSLKKMLMLASMALAAILFAVPAAAQANVVLTEKGVPLAEHEIVIENEEEKTIPGAEITATSSNLTTATANGTLACKNVTLHFEVLTNGPKHVELKPLGDATTSECEVEELGFPVTIENGAVTSNLTIDTWGTGGASATFESHVFSPEDPEHTTPLLSCHFAGNVHVQGVESGTDLLDVGPSTLAGEGENCSEQGLMQGQFTLETNDKDTTPVDLDFVETP